MSRAEVEYLEGIVRSLTTEDEPPLEGLTKTESIIVRRMERAHGGVVTYERLLDATSWNTEEPPFLCSLKTHICHIRRKRPDIGKRLYTVRSLGYGLRLKDNHGEINHGARR